MVDDKKTIRQIQKELFHSSLSDQLNTLEHQASERNAKLTKRAEELVDQGFSQEESIDILAVEGFEPELARGFFASASAEEEVANSSGFDTECPSCGGIQPYSAESRTVNCSGCGTMFRPAPKISSSIFDR